MRLSVRVSSMDGMVDGARGGWERGEGGRAWGLARGLLEERAVGGRW